ncbi:hypothetical protein J0664_05855 [Rhizobium leguminosarum]|uniref:hypothetical protein n=1 Tax=Rhizobium leguminosarum TaxID=384 RepID=UPI001A937A8D|nr:hypothetical protein [Rhizobium leguminosarum]MBY5553766.1 hypothetical protein [Rhizobium leguminosarum]QSW24823.1 hypothetical protein J0664_05855 [Rhizobium leguminosarum]
MICPDCDCIGTGDIVQHKMNANVFGVVIGFMGTIVIIRVAPTLEVLQFHEWELDLVDDDDVPTPPTAAKQPVDDNVIEVDFTKRQIMTRKTKTEGAA